jgi:hypothetical protein
MEDAFASDEISEIESETQNYEEMTMGVMRR